MPGRGYGNIVAMTHHRHVVSALGAPDAVGAYSHAVRAGGLLFCSGQIPLDPETGELAAETPGDQARRCLDNLAIVAAAGGAQLADAVRITLYLTDIDAFREVDDVYATYFESEPPARVAIGVAALPRGAKVEIDAVVALPD